MKLCDFADSKLPTLIVNFLITLFQNNASKMLLAVMESHQDMDIVERILVKIGSPGTLVCVCVCVGGVGRGGGCGWVCGWVCVCVHMSVLNA